MRRWRTPQEWRWSAAKAVIVACANVKGIAVAEMKITSASSIVAWHLLGARLRGLERAVNESRRHRSDLGAWPVETPDIETVASGIDAELEQSTQKLGGATVEIGSIAAVNARTQPGFPVRV